MTKQGQLNAIKNRVHIILGKEVKFFLNFFKTQVKEALTKEQTRRKLIEEKSRKAFLTNISEKATKSKKFL